MKFRVLDGSHQVFIRGEHPREITVKRYARGSIVESDVDLCRRGNRPGCKKYERVDDDATPLSIDPTPPTTDEEPEVDDVYAGMSKEALIKLAKDNDIDLGKAKTKQDILDIIRSIH